MKHWDFNSNDWHSDAVVEFRDGPVPVLIHHAGRYPADAYVRASDGASLGKCDYVRVALGGETRHEAGRVSRVFKSAQVDRVTTIPNRPLGNGMISPGYTACRTQGGMVIIQTDGLDEAEQIAKLILLSEPFIAAAAADDGWNAYLAAGNKYVTDSILSIKCRRLSRPNYELLCDKYSVDALSDDYISASYGIRYAVFSFPAVSVEKVICNTLAKFRLWQMDDETRERAKPSVTPAEPRLESRPEGPFQAVLTTCPQRGGEVVVNGWTCLVVSREQHTISEDDPSIWGSSLLGHEGDSAWLAQLTPVG